MLNSRFWCLDWVEATRQLTLLARDMKHMRGFVYVSTAFVNANLPAGSHVEERIYPLHGANLQHSALAAQLAAMKPQEAEKTVKSPALLH